MFRYKLYILCMLCMMIFASCGDSDDDPKAGVPDETVTLLIAAPKTAETRANVGDPGQPVPEGENWDKMAIIFAYTSVEEAPSTYQPVIVKTLSKTEFESLPRYNDTQYRLYSVMLKAGKVFIYGVTYTEGAANNPETDINACTTGAAVEALTISNDYASGDANSAEKFVSVATGYYMDDNTQKPAEFDISAKSPIHGELAPYTIPSMKLTRLAAKIDIQWDAQDAYDNSYTDVQVNSFAFYGDKGLTVSTTPTVPTSPTGSIGKGRLFPDLVPAGSGKLAGSQTFYNKSEISKRNGRVYHYVFPDGVSTPKVVFYLSATKDNTTIEVNPYTFNFTSKLLPSIWYQVNTTIRGISENTTVTISN